MKKFFSKKTSIISLVTVVVASSLCFFINGVKASPFSTSVNDIALNRSIASRQVPCEVSSAVTTVDEETDLDTVAVTGRLANAAITQTIEAVATYVSSSSEKIRRESLED